MPFLVNITNNSPAGTARLFSSNLGGIGRGKTGTEFINRVRAGTMQFLGDTGQDALDNTDTTGVYAANSDVDGWPHSLPAGGYTKAQLLFSWRNHNPDYHSVPHEFKWTGTGTVTASGITGWTEIGPNHYRGTPNMSDWGLGLFDFPGAEGDYVRDIQIYRTQDEALFNAGQTFNPDYLALLRGLKEIRVMDWQMINPTPPTLDVPSATYFTNAGYPTSPELIAELANEIGADPWVCMHHLTGPAYWDEFAERLFNALDTDRTVKVTYSNETWNTSFPVHSRDIAAARTLWGGGATDFWQDSYYSYQLTRILTEFEKHFPRNRIKLVLETHVSRADVTELRLQAPAWQDNDPVNYIDPATVIDEIAGTTYLGAQLITTQAYLEEVLAQIAARTQSSGFEWMTSYLLGSTSWASGQWDAMTNALNDQKTIADREGVPVTLYEGGQHLLHSFKVTIDPDDLDVLTEFLSAYINSEHMAAFYQKISDFWLTISPDEPNMQFGIIGLATRFGAWSLVENYGEPFSPRAELVFNGYIRGGPVTDYSSFLVPFTPIETTADVRLVVETTDGLALTYEGSPLTNAAIDGGTATGAILVGGELRNETTDGFKGQSGETVQVKSDQGYFVYTLQAAPAGDYVQTFLVTDGSAVASTNNGGFAQSKPDSAMETVSFWASFGSTPNFKPFMSVGGGIDFRWSGGKMRLVIRDTDQAIVADLVSTTNEPLDEVAHHFVSINLAVPSLVWKRNGVDVTFTETTALTAGTGLVGKYLALQVTGQTGTSMSLADLAIFYGSLQSASDLYAGGTPPDPRTIGAPDYLISYPIRADDDVFGDTTRGLNDGYHIGSAGLFTTASGWTVPV